MATTISVTNTFANDQISIGFDLHDGSIPFPPFQLSTVGDIELNPLVLKLAELMEYNKEILFSFEGFSEEEMSPKLDLVKNTLEEVYNTFNENIFAEDDQAEDSDEDSEELF